MKQYSYGIVPYIIIDNEVYVLVSKPLKFQDYYGFFKGRIEENETIKECAIREFFEETSIKVDVSWLENFFIQKNRLKDIGIFLVDMDNILDQKVILNNENYSYHIINLKELNKNIVKNQKKIVNNLFLYFKNIDKFNLKNRFK